ncbi:MAG TPA: hypothetical protein VHE79_07770 [Spirochaetia bacterium]
MDLGKGEILIVRGTPGKARTVVRYHEAPTPTPQGLFERLEQERASGFTRAQAWIERPGKRDPLHPSWRTYFVLNPILEPNAERSLDPSLIEEEKRGFRYT